MKIKMTVTKSINQRGNAQGNAMIYVLIALALFGFLTVTLSRQNDQADGQDLSDEQAELYADELIEYTTAANHVVTMMLASGSEVNDLDFVDPSDAAFDTGSHIHKVFHPQGGGLNYSATFNEKIEFGASGAWYFQDNLNVEWTDTTGNDAILMAYNINPTVCENINLKITGMATIPATTVGLNNIFNPATYTEAEFNTTNCPGCDGYPMLCISNAVPDTYGFYSIIAAQ
jgi:hypothetical protein